MRDFRRWTTEESKHEGDAAQLTLIIVYIRIVFSYLINFLGPRVGEDE